MYGDAAEQIVRMTLEGVEVTAKISGEAAKDIAILLAAVAKEDHRTKGKTRLSSMIRSGKELKVFSMQNKDLEKFAKEAKRYGVLYTVLKDKDNAGPTGVVDIIARAEDASKIQRIMDRFELSTVKINPTQAQTERGHQSEQHSTYQGLEKSAYMTSKEKRSSVRQKLKDYKAAIDKTAPKLQLAERVKDHERG